MAGKAGRSGRKSKAEEMGLTQLLDTCWPLSDREKTIKRLADLASRGNMQAITLLLAYAYGKPKERHEITGENGGAIVVKGYVTISPDDWDVQSSTVASGAVER